jgi:hypothetical protein
MRWAGLPQEERDAWTVTQAFRAVEARMRSMASISDPHANDVASIAAELIKARYERTGTTLEDPKHVGDAFRK